MKTQSKKLLEVLFGGCKRLEGGTPLRNHLGSPKLDGSTKDYYWEGEKGLIVTMLDRIEELEKEVNKLKK